MKYFIHREYMIYIKGIYSDLTNTHVFSTQPEKENQPVNLQSVVCPLQLHPPFLRPSQEPRYWILCLSFTFFIVHHISMCPSNNTFYLCIYFWTSHKWKHIAFTCFFPLCIMCMRFIEDDTCSKNINQSQSFLNLIWFPIIWRIKCKLRPASRSPSRLLWPHLCSSLLDGLTCTSHNGLPTPNPGLCSSQVAPAFGPLHWLCSWEFSFPNRCTVAPSTYSALSLNVTSSERSSGTTLI